MSENKLRPPFDALLRASEQVVPYQTLFNEIERVRAIAQQNDLASLKHILNIRAQIPEKARDANAFLRCSAEAIYELAQEWGVQP